jgi:alkylation response protein AidB-like acyl-CoA dehydrogenase
MDVRFSSEQRALRDSVTQLVDRLHPEAVRDLSDDERVAKLDAAVAAAGWRELRAAEEESGVLLGQPCAPLASGVEVAIVAEQLAIGAVDTAFIGPVLAADLRRLAGAPAAAGETVAFAVDLAGPAQATGAALFDATIAVDAAEATAALVLTGDGGLAQVPLESSTTVVDLTRRVADVAAGTSVTPLPGPLRALSEDDLARWTALGLALSCADLVGVMRGGVLLARDYARTRHQYGAAIGSFQAVQHLLADAHVATEGSASIALHAAWAVDALASSEALVAASGAKAYCARAARSVCETVIQVHGGIGNTWECMAHVYLRRALMSTDLFGGVDANLARVLDHWALDESSTGAAR